MLETAHASTASPSTGPDRESWSTLARITFRFFFIYLLLYLLPRPFIPSLGLPRIPLVSRSLYEGWRALLTFVTGDILGWSPPQSAFSYGGGDAPADYVRLLCCAVLALAGTLVWSLLRPSPAGYPRLHAGFRLYLRLVLGISMLGYGMAKLFGQFAYSPIQLVRPIGQLEPMQMLWMFMGASTPYSVLTGVIEMVAGVLLFFNRTTVLGALLAVAAMGNVIALNFSYDVPVKIQSTHFALVALFLVAPHARRLTDAVLGPRTQPSWRPRTRRFVFAAQALLVVFVAARLVDSFAQRGPTSRAPASAALAGLHEVTAFRDGDALRPPLLTDAERWRRVAVDGTGDVAVQLMDDTIRRFTARGGADAGVLVLQGGGLKAPLALHVRETSPETLELDGERDGRRLTIELRRIPDASFPLLARRVRWTR